MITQARVPAGSFVMGDSSGDGNRGDGETPRHRVTLEGFEIDATTVRNADFARFVDATGYRTEAETFGSSAVFHLAIAAPDADIMGPAAGTPWWFGVRGADWAHPGGSRSDLDGLADHPVVHVSWNENSLEDGWLTTAPVRAFAPNGYGLFQPVGNVWEWCADWFDPGAYIHAEASDPRGPLSGTARVLRGGSYLCHISYCNRYRNSARSSNTPDSSIGNAGFRTVTLRTENA